MSETPEIELWVSVETEEDTAETSARGPSASGARDGEDVGGGWGKPIEKATEAIARTAKHKRIPLDATLLKTQMGGLIAIAGDLFEQAAAQEHMKLDELQLSVEIDGEGKVNLVGNHAKIGNRGGITMKFTAKQP